MKPQQTVVLIAEDTSSVNQGDDLKTVIDHTRRWQEAWQGRDHGTYVGSYSPNFRFRGKGLRNFAKYKKRVFKSYKSMKVGFSNTRVFTHDKYAISIMNQDFNGDNRYISRGRKNSLLGQTRWNLENRS